ncbi:MAG: hypothetical protein HYX60_03590 [Legionella longbeachae]|nr:hypothetical protein [Legionella longbeachae]
MSNKWSDFKKEYNSYQSSTSPFALNNISQAEANIVQDWNRVDAGPVTINGKSIQEILKSDRNLEELPESGSLFNNEDELKIFFRKHLAKNIREEDKDTVVEQMMRFLHQGALQTPVSAAAYTHLSKIEGNNLEPCDARYKDDKNVPGQHRMLNFIATETGFKVQEILTQNKMTYNINDVRATEIVAPDPGKEYIYKAQGTISIDFSKNPSAPNIEVESSTISFGSKQVEKLLDQRGVLDKFIDTIKNIFGYNKVENLSKVEEEPPSMKL